MAQEKNQTMMAGMTNDDLPECSGCGEEIVAPLGEVIPGANWICLECSGATLEDF